MAKNIPTWSEAVNWGIEKYSSWLSEKWLAIKWAIIWATALLLQACSPAQAADSSQSSSEVVQTAQLSQTIQPKVTNASFSTPEVSKQLDINEMNISELKAERKLVKIKIAQLEADMDNLTDAQWDELDWYNQILIDLAKAETAAEKAETAAEKAETAVAEQRLQRAEKLAGIN